MIYKKLKLAFTLLEIIVVTLLLLIITVIFLDSITWYLYVARDTRRLSDATKIQSVLEIEYLNLLKYPNPSDSFSVFHSWTKVWDQWVFWKSIIDNFKNSFEIPVDPLTGLKYTYSLTSNKKQYQLGWMHELSNFALKTDFWVTQVAKDNIISHAFIRWNYNWLAIKINSWSLCEIQSLPSIISSASSLETELINLINNKELVYNNFFNLPSNIAWSVSTNWWFDFESGQLVVYSDTDKCRKLYDENDNTERKTLITNLQKAYTWSIISEQENILRLLYVDIDDQNALDDYSINFVKNKLSWK